MINRTDLRNIAIIAHVDHGKTTLVDEMLKQSGIFRDNQQVAERVMDSNDLERERGITILSKNTAIEYKNTKINVVDTPGHADFGGEVERILKMVDSVILLVDAFEGAMPQTRFVLKKALSLHLVPIVVINKIDRKDARPDGVIEEIIDLFIELDANDDQLEFPVLYASGRNGYAMYNAEDEPENLLPLLDTIIDKVPCPKGDTEAPLQLLVSSIDYNEYTGRIAVGRVERGTVNIGQQVVICRYGTEEQRTVKINNISMFSGLGRSDFNSAKVGDIVSVSGIGDIDIGETICSVNTPEPLPFIEIDKPVISMNFIVNNSPFAGKEGKYVTSRHIRGRLYKELQTNVSLEVEDTASPDTLKVSGRGELHLSILIETMRREGYEFQISRPEVIVREIDGIKCEPVEYLVIDVPEEFMGTVMERLGSRKAEMKNMHPISSTYNRIEYRIPARGLIGFRSEFLTITKGNGIMNHVFDAYEPYKGDITCRTRGSVIAWETGESVVYGLYNAQERGTLFIGPNVKVYSGMIVGESARVDDITINVCKKKQITNIRASGSDEALKLTPAKILSLEQSLEFIAEDELVEVTPDSIRLRKRILDQNLRAKQKK